MSTTHTTQYQASIVEFALNDCLGIEQPMSDSTLATQICTHLGLELVEDIDSNEGVWLVAGLTDADERMLEMFGVVTKCVSDQTNVYQLQIELDA